MENTKLTYEEFRTKRLEWDKKQPSYMQKAESDFENMTKHIYETYYLKGREFAFTRGV